MEKLKSTKTNYIPDLCKPEFNTNRGNSDANCYRNKGKIDKTKGKICLNCPYGSIH